MKKNVLIFGFCSGLLITLMMVITSMLCYNNPNFEGSMLLGYATMLIAFSFIFVGIKNFRDKYNDGLITFGKAFKIGLLICLIASTCYVLAWLVEFYVFIPDFMDKYVDHVLKQSREAGATEAEIAKQVAEMATYRDMYKNPLGVIFLTYVEVLPMGLLIALISALILKRKRRNTDPTVAA